jgi:hypothetical protein
LQRRSNGDGQRGHHRRRHRAGHPGRGRMRSLRRRRRYGDHHAARAGREQRAQRLPSGLSAGVRRCVPVLRAGRKMLAGPVFEHLQRREYLLRRGFSQLRTGRWLLVGPVFERLQRWGEVLRRGFSQLRAGRQLLEPTVLDLVPSGRFVLRRRLSELRSRWKLLEPPVRDALRHRPQHDMLRTGPAMPEQRDVLTLSASPRRGAAASRPLSAPCCAP